MARPTIVRGGHAFRSELLIFEVQDRTSKNELKFPTGVDNLVENSYLEFEPYAVS